MQCINADRRHVWIVLTLGCQIILFRVGRRLYLPRPAGPRRTSTPRRNTYASMWRYICAVCANEQKQPVLCQRRALWRNKASRLCCRAWPTRRTDSEPDAPAQCKDKHNWNRRVYIHGMLYRAFSGSNKTASRRPWGLLQGDFRTKYTFILGTRFSAGRTRKKGTELEPKSRPRSTPKGPMDTYGISC
jgi:hypothetical protein